MKTWRLPIVFIIATLLTVVVMKAIRFKNFKNNLPRVHSAKICNNKGYIKVRVSNAQLSQIDNRAFYVKPVDTFYWNNKCRGIKGETVVYEPSDSSGIPVRICEE